MFLLLSFRESVALTFAAAGMCVWRFSNEFKADLAAYLAMSGHPSGMRGLADLIAFNEANASREMPYFGQEIFIAAEEKGDLSSPEYLEALETARRLRDRTGQPDRSRSRNSRSSLNAVDVT